MKINHGPTAEYDSTLKKFTRRGATSFPEEVFDYKDELEILDLSGGHLRELPDNFGLFRKLKIVFLSNNDFDEVPGALRNCSGLIMVGLKSCQITRFKTDALPPKLRGLILTDNKLAQLPDDIGNLKNLQKLMLSGNRLTALPPSLANLESLELLRVAANSLEKEPSWLFGMPTLAWFSDAGNQYSLRPPLSQGHGDEVAWSDLMTGIKIGESAKSSVYKAVIRTNNQEVAIKEYKSVGITADGDYADEIRANILAGEHPNIVGFKGLILGAPQNHPAIALSLVPDSFALLGRPPSFETITRDEYPDNIKFSIRFVAKMMQGIAAAITHLHARGIMHGDLYAHNVLTDKVGTSLIGDFGAASIYAVSNQARERVEILAFGRLMQELIERTQNDGNDQLLIFNIRELAAECVKESSRRHLTFSQIFKIMNDFQD